jgi:hypothetical protein
MNSKPPTLHVADRDGAGALTVDDDAAVHLRVLDRDPVTSEPDHGLEVGRRVEVVGEDAVGLGGPEQDLAGIGRVDAVRLQPHHEAREVVLLLGAHGEDGVRLVDRRLADGEAVDRVVAAVLEDVVEDPGEHSRVDEMSAYLDGLAVHRGLSFRRRARRRLRRPVPSPSVVWASCGRRA